MEPGKDVIGKHFERTSPVQWEAVEVLNNEERFIPSSTEHRVVELTEKPGSNSKILDFNYS